MDLRLVKIIKLVFLFSFLLGSFSWSIITVSAQTNTTPQGSGFRPPDLEGAGYDENVRQGDIRKLTLQVVNYFLGFLGLFSVLVIIYAGILMVSSTGDEEQFKKGKTMIMYAGVGIIVILMSYAFVAFIFQAAGPSTGQTTVTSDGESTSSTGDQTIQGELGDLQEVVDSLTDNLENDIFGETDLGSLDDLLNYIQSLAGRIPNTAANQAIIRTVEDLVNTIINQGDLLIQGNGEVTIQGLMILMQQLMTTIQSLENEVGSLPVMQARISATPGRGSSPMTVVLDGRGSIDPTKATIPDKNYFWFYNDTSGQLQGLPPQSILEHTFTEPGKYVIGLQVATATMLEGHKTAIDGLTFIEILVDPPSAEVQMTINGDDPIDLYKVTLAQAQAGLNFDPSNSNPGLGKTFVKYDWDFGDLTAEQTTAPGAINHVFNEARDYRVVLSVTDDANQINRQIVFLKVKAIIADINIHPLIGNTTSTFSFDADNSRVDEGEITQYGWTILQNGQEIAQSDLPVFEHRFIEPGTYEVRLRVKDSQGREDTDVHVLEVASQAPSSYFSVVQLNDYTPSTFVFDASGTIDHDKNDQLKYSWDFDGDGQFEIKDDPDKREVSYRFREIGNYDTVLKVTDKYGAEDTYKRRVKVESVLDIDFEADRFAAQVKNPIRFTAKSRNAVSYYWLYGDQTVEQTDKLTVVHPYIKQGVFTVTLTAFDDNDNETTVTKDVHIGPENKPLAVIKALVNDKEMKVQPDVCGRDKDGFIVFRTDTISFNAGYSINIDGTNQGLQYTWDLGSQQYGTNKRVTHRYSDLTGSNDCNEIKLVVKDRLTGASNVSKILYVRVENKRPIFNRFIVNKPTKDLITPISIPVQISGAQDTDGKIMKYKFWYYYLDSDEKFGVQVLSQPSTILNVVSQGYQGQEHEIYFAGEAIDNDNGSTSNLDLEIESIPLIVTNGANQPPDLELCVNKTTINAGEAITFYAKAHDSQGEKLSNDSFAWDLDGDGEYETFNTGPQVTQVYDLPGQYEVSVRVTARGLSSIERHKIYVEQTSGFPISAFLYDINDLEVAFDASNSQVDSSISGNRLSYIWDFDLSNDSNGDGEKDNDVDAETRVVNFIYPESGEYQVKLTVQDIVKSVDMVTHKIRVGTSTVTGKERESLKITAQDQSITLLNLKAKNGVLRVGDSTILEGLIINADGSPFSGQVRFELIQGSGYFEPPEVWAINSKARTIYKATDPGQVTILVTAKNTIFGNIYEKINLDVQP